MRVTIKSVLLSAVCGASIATAGPLMAEDWAPNYSFFGTSGLVEMPSALSMPDAELGMSLNAFGLQQKISQTFQISPRLSGTFRYSRLDQHNGPGTDETYDRSFDLQYRILDETDWRPTVAIGLRDFMGTGLLTSEYVVATKTVAENFRLTAGLGWGRMGSYNGFTNPLGVLSSDFETRPGRGSDNGGIPAWNQYFRGDAAVFGGVEWHVSPKLTFVAEYSSDAYVRETTNGSFDPQSPLNFGLTYRPNERYQISAYSLYGTDFGIGLTAAINPSQRAGVGGLEAAPIPVAVRPEDARAALSWNHTPEVESAMRQGLAQALAVEGIELHSAAFTDRSIRLRYTNTRYRSEVQAIGRISRILTQALPPSIEDFILEPMQRGIPLSSTTVHRSDMENLENRTGAVEEIYLRSLTTEVPPDDGLVEVGTGGARFDWGILPYGELTLFDSANPAGIELGLEASMRYEIRPNIVVSGSVRKELWSNRDGLGTIKPSTLPPVRRNAPYYALEGDGGINNLTVAWYGRLGPELYSRVTFGYIEAMHGGISTEVLWKPVEGNFAVGGELNYTMQRDYDMRLGFQDYDVISGHLSGYWEMDRGYHIQVDAGRYLAGDWGATLSVNREFDNGWRVGAYATLTDVPFDDFGEGSFDKGIMLTIPTDWADGRPSRSVVSTKLSSLTRDGGARLSVEDRLYQVVRGGHITDYGDSWGRFWR